MEVEMVEVEDSVFVLDRQIRFAIDVVGVAYMVQQYEDDVSESDNNEAPAQINNLQDGAGSQEHLQNLGNESGNPLQRDDEENHEPIQLADQRNIKFPMPNDPAPKGNECILYMARNIAFSAKRSDRGIHEGFCGELRGENELLLLDFNLVRCTTGEYYNLKIQDKSRPFESHLSLARFQQAELLLQFLKVEPEGTVVIHEEPPFRVSLDLPHHNWTVQSGWENILQSRSYPSVLCSKVIPADKLWQSIGKQGFQQQFFLRIHWKLTQGSLDILHGIQKCFHPDKALYHLRDTLAETLVNAEETDMIIVSGEGNHGFRCHRSILSANSPVFKACLLSKLKEQKSGIIHTAPFVTGKVLEVLLKFLYARNRKDLDHNPVLTMRVLQTAHIYEIPLLVEICEESLLAMPIELFSVKSCLDIFPIAELLDMEAIETKIVHILLRMDIKLSSSQVYIDFLRNSPAAAAKMTDMIVEFKKSQNSH